MSEWETQGVWVDNFVLYLVGSRNRFLQKSGNSCQSNTAIGNFSLTVTYLFIYLFVAYVWVYQ